MKTKKIEITWNGEKKNVTMKKLSFGEYNALQEEATEITVVANQAPIVKPSPKKMTEIGILKSIVDAPFTISIQEVQKLEREDGFALWEAFSELNELDTKKKD